MRKNKKEYKFKQARDATSRSTSYSDDVGHVTDDGMKGFSKRLWMFGLAVCLCHSVSASATDALLPYEQAFYSNTYEREPLSSRLERLEMSVFGERQPGSELERQSRLLKVLSGLPHHAGSAHNTPEKPVAAETPAPPPSLPPAKDATDYPTVTALEQIVFSRDFIRDDVSARLDRLERHAFGTASPHMALVDRVDRLLAKYPEAGQKRFESTEQASDVLRQLPSDPSQFTASDRDIYSKVEALERRFFNRTNTRILLSERLEQLELKAYGKSYAGESIDTRVNRLINQFRVADSQTPPSSRRTARQNVQIGAGFQQNSQIQFSQDLLNMLPDDVRAQLQNQSQSGTAIGGTGTVIIEQNSTSQYPGFQQYGGAPLQYYNYYGSPNVTIEQRTTTTVIQPDGNRMVYSYNTPGALTNPAYVGDPAFLQQLNSVEINVFGRVDSMQPIQTRLLNLEMAVLRKTQPHLPPPERLDAVFRAWKIRQIGQVLGTGKS